jgi:hypothetical protein
MITLTVFLIAILAFVIWLTLITKSILFPYTDIGSEYFDHVVDTDVLLSCIVIFLPVALGSIVLLGLIFSSFIRRKSTNNKRKFFSIPIIILLFQLSYLSFTEIYLIQLSLNLVPCDENRSINQYCYTIVNNKFLDRDKR